MYSFYLLLITTIFFTQCTTPEDQVQNIDNQLDIKGSIGASEVGINKNNQAIIQETRKAEMGLMEIQFKNTRLEKEVSLTYQNLLDCYIEMSRNKLKGDSKLPELPELSEFKDKFKESKITGINKEGKFVTVKKQIFNKKLENEEQKHLYYKDLLNIIKKEYRQCKFQLGERRSRAGLPIEKAKAKGHFDSNGNWIEDEAEKNLDEELQEKSN